MIIKKFSIKRKFITILLLIAVSSLGYAENKDGVSSNSLKKQASTSTSSDPTGKVGDSYRFNINNINLPINSRGVLAAVNVDEDGSAAYYGGFSFLFSGGFFMSGFSGGRAETDRFVAGQATASLVENFIPGLVGKSSDSRAQLYVVAADDAPFSQSWTDWKDAVDLGADFYDGDGDGKYNPVDLNGNKQWDTNEDMPDLLGDRTAWCVFNDGVTAGQRGSYYTGMQPQGIEVRQTVFGFASKGAIGNIIFVRYRIKNTGLKADTLKDVMLGVWADPDLGDYDDDLVGCDIPRNAGFVYNDADDKKYGANPPCFLIDFFSGPKAYVAGETYTDINGNGVFDEADTPIDTAWSVRGLRIGKKAFPGAKNLGISSFVHYQQGVAPIKDPTNYQEAWFYLHGQTQEGTQIDPCNWALGKVYGGDCKAVNKNYWYSGDPVTKKGWINTSAHDQRMMQNTGPFTLVKGEEIEVVVAYVVGQGTDALGSVTEAKRIDDGAQFIFDRNFETATPPPAPVVETKTLDDKIELTWETKKQVSYEKKTELYDMKFQGFNVYAFRVNSTGETIDGKENIKLIQTYDMKDFVKDVYKEDDYSVPRKTFLYNTDNQLDSALYADSSKGRIKLVIDKDPFTDGELIKGRPYYFAVTSYAINMSSIYNKNPKRSYGRSDDYILSNKSLFAEAENVYKIIPVTVGEDIYDLAAYRVDAGKSIGASDGTVAYDILDKTAVTGDKYEVSFFVDSSTKKYSTFWKLKNVTKNTVLVDSVKKYLYGTTVVAESPRDGILVKVSEEIPSYDTLKFETKDKWINIAESKLHYVSDDILQSSKIISIGGNLNQLNGTYVRADQMRQVVLKFDQPGKAYRYVNGFYGNALNKKRSFVYAEAIKDSTLGLGKFGQGFVDVPFTAWVEDTRFGEKRQLAVAFIEKSVADGGKPDGIWNPGTALGNTGEYIFVFNSDYDPTGSQRVYKGDFTNAASPVWADLGSGKYYYDILPANSNFTADEKKIAKSPFFNTLYAIGLPRQNDSLFYSSSDKITVLMDNYPYTEKDKFTFTTNPSGRLTSEDEKKLFDKVNVYPNPLFGYNVATSYDNSAADEPFVTFSNLPEEVTIKIYSLSGALLRTLTTSDKTSSTSPRIRWDLQNESGLRVASGMYLAIVSSPNYGDKVLKFAIIMPQKQLPKY